MKVQIMSRHRKQKPIVQPTKRKNSASAKASPIRPAEPKRHSIDVFDQAVRESQQLSRWRPRVPPGMVEGVSVEKRHSTIGTEKLVQALKEI